MAGGWTPRSSPRSAGRRRPSCVAAAPDNPVYIQLFYSSVLLTPAGFAALNITRDEDVPPRGKLERDADGKPTGWIAGDNPTISGLFDKLPLPTFAQSVEGTKQFFRELNRLGLTGVSDPGGFNLTAESYRPLFQVWQDRALTVRVVYSLFAQRRGKELEDIQAMTQMLPMGFGDDWLRFNGIGENVTWGLYNNDTPTDAQKQQYYELAKWAAARGMTLTQHWNNNKSVHHLLDVIERVNKEIPIAQLRWSVVHLNDATPESLARMKALGLGWLMQNAMYFQGEAFLRERGNEVDAPDAADQDRAEHGADGRRRHRCASRDVVQSVRLAAMDARRQDRRRHGDARRRRDAEPRGGAAALYAGQHLVHPRRGQARHAWRRASSPTSRCWRKDYMTMPVGEIGALDVAAHDGRRADRLRGGALSGAGGRGEAGARTQAHRAGCKLPIRPATARASCRRRGYSWRRTGANARPARAGIAD